MIPSESTGLEGALGQVDRFLLLKGDVRALRFLVNHLFVPHNRREWIWSRVPLGILGLPQWGLSAPLGLPAERPTDLIGEVLDWARAELSRGREGGWSFILHRDRTFSEWTRLLLFLFHGRGREPVAVVKLARQGLRSEWEALRYLNRALPSELAATVPVPALYRWFGGAEAVLMRSLAGRSMFHQIGFRPLAPRKVARHLSNGATWLACFHLVTRDPTARFRADEEALRVRSDIPAWFDVAELDALSSEQLEFPLSASHGDFWARNLLVRPRSGGRPQAMTEISGVVDWEHFSRSAPPFEDLFHFALTYALDYPWSPFARKPPEDAFRRGFLSDNAVSRGIRSAFLGYCDLTGLPFEKLKPLFQLFLLGRSRRQEASRRVPWSSLHRLVAEGRGTVFDWR